MDDEAGVIFSFEEIAGVWANRFAVYFNPHELTIDFIRDDPRGSRSICVSRVSFTASLGVDLANALDDVLQEWMTYAIPEEERRALRERLHRRSAEADES